MNAFTLTATNAPAATGFTDRSQERVEQTSRHICSMATGHQFRNQMAEEAFEAGVQWFLAVSRAA